MSEEKKKGISNKDWGKLKKEAEANTFAMELLVPAHMLTADLEGATLSPTEQPPNELVERLAKRYEVEEGLMRTRIMQVAFNPQRS